MKLKEIKPGIVIHCKTENEANRLLWELIHLGYRWWNGKSICELHFEDSVNGCGYWIKDNKTVDWGRIGYYKERTTEYGEIIPFSTFIIEEKTYEDGLNEAWKVLAHIQSGEISIDEMRNIWGLSEFDIVNNFTKMFTPQEAIAKLKAYEEEKRIEVGNVVNVINNESNDSESGLFLGEDWKNYWVLFPKYDVPQSLGKTRYRIKKTGKHIDISSVLVEIEKWQP